MLSRYEFAQQLFKIEDPYGRFGLGLASRGCVAPSSDLEHVTRTGCHWDALTDLRYELQLESESTNLKMLDSGRIF